MKSNDWKTTSARAMRGGVRTGLTLGKAMAPLLRADLSGPAMTNTRSVSPTAHSWTTSAAYDFGFVRGRKDRAYGLTSLPEGAVGGSDIDRDGPALGMSPTDVERAKERIRAGYLAGHRSGHYGDARYSSKGAAPTVRAGQSLAVVDEWNKVGVIDDWRRMSWGQGLGQNSHASRRAAMARLASITNVGTKVGQLFSNLGDVSASVPSNAYWLPGFPGEHLPAPRERYKKTYDQGFAAGVAACEQNRREGIHTTAGTPEPGNEYSRGWKDGYDQCAMVVTRATSAAMEQPPPSSGISRFFTNAPLSQQQQQYRGPSQIPVLRIPLPTGAFAGPSGNPDDYKNGFALGAGDCKRSFHRVLATGPGGVSDDYQRGYLAGRMSCTDGSSGGVTPYGSSGSGYVPPHGSM